MRYYYFAATLPWLTLDGKPPISFDAFVEQGASFLSSRDFSALRALCDPLLASDGHPFVRTWRAVETHLRNAIARVRASRRRRDATPYLREAVEAFDTSLEQAVTEAFSLADPMVRERALDRLRWSKLDELAGYDPFSGVAVLAYGMKLRLVERWAALKEAEAAERVETLVAREPQDNASKTED